MSRDLTNLASVGVLACALVVTALAVRRELTSPANQDASSYQVITVPDWTPRNLIGPDDAQVIIIEFSDFQCPFCERFMHVLDTVVEQYSGAVAYDYRHYPQEEIHPAASRIATASECARAQGMFEPFYRLAFRRQASLAEANVVDLAQEAGVHDVSAFVTCLTDVVSANAVSNDVSIAQSLNIRGTPSLIIGNRRYSGVVSVAELREAVDEELAREDGWMARLFGM